LAKLSSTANVLAHSTDLDDLGQFNPIIIEKSGSATAAITTETDINGATVTFTTDRDLAAVVWATFDFDQIAGGASDIYVGYINVDGTNQTAAASFQPGGNLREIISQIAVFPLARGSHTVKLRATRQSGTGSLTVNAAHTKFVIWLVGAANVTNDTGS